MFSCEICEALQKIIFKENCCSTASDFQEHFGVLFLLSAINQLIVYEFQKQLFTSDSQFLLWKYLKIIRIQTRSRVTFPSWHEMPLRDLNQISIERDFSETSQKHIEREDFFCYAFQTSQRCLFSDIFKTSQKLLKEHVFSMRSLRCLDHIFKKISIP